MRTLFLKDFVDFHRIRKIGFALECEAPFLNQFKDLLLDVNINNLLKLAL
jgi:hypothetical protein